VRTGRAGVPLALDRRQAGTCAACRAPGAAACARSTRPRAM